MTLDDAVELLVEGDAEGSVAALRVLATREPLNPDVHHHLGRALVALGQYGPAIVAFKMATRCAPAFLGAWVQLALCQRELGALDEAIASGEHALRLSADDSDALHLLGVAHAERGGEGDFARAEGYLREVLKGRGLSAEARVDAEVLHQAIRLKLAANSAN